MTREIRRPAEEERYDVADVLRVSLNFGRDFVADRAKVLPLQDMRCVVEDGRIVATAGERRFTQWFGGRELAMSGIWGVATLPEHRGAGNATAAVMALLREARDRGDPLTALYPAILQPYRRLGYEIAGSYVTHEIRIDDLPRANPSALAVEAFDADRDAKDVRECYRRAMSVHNGPIDSDDPWWWSDRILGHWRADEIHRVVVVRGPSDVEGYASFVYEPHEGFLDVSFRLACKHLVATTPDAFHALLAFARGFGGVGQALRFTGRPDEALSLGVEVQRLAIESSYRWMLRLLDVQKALEGRGYPNVAGEATIAVEDGLLPENEGPWRIAADGAGRVGVERAVAASGPAIPIGALSSIYSGFLSPFDAVRIGAVGADDPAVPFLAQLFSGPAPFMLDFF